MSERQKKKLAQREANRLKRRMIEKVLSTSRTSNVAFNLNLLLDGWLELESDPGTFSLLLEDFGCFGAQVDEIYDLEQKFEGPVFGFIFLFKWLNNQHTDRLRNQKSSTSSSSANNTSNERHKDPQHQPDQQSPEQGQWSYVEDENIISEIYFAKQMISNSCATHALISILLNCDYQELNLGPTLTRLKEHTKSVNPETKGYAIGNLPELAKAHNSHASYSSLYNRNKPSSHSGGMSFMISGNQRTNLQQQNKHEAYHFVSYVPINNRLYELDGLKNYPIDHGPFGPKEDWTEKFKSVIKQRLLANKTGDDATISNDIRYSLMAVVPDKRVCLRAQLKKLNSHLDIVHDGIKRLTERVSVPLSIDTDIPNPPYSPLSNGTLTASEAGSVYNSPTNLGGCFFSDDDECGVDKYFFVRFDEKADTSEAKGENSEPAHQNCIVQIESTNVHPLDMAVVSTIADRQDTETKTPPDNVTNDHDENAIKCKTPSNDINENSEFKTTEETDQAKFTGNLRKKSPLAQEAQVSVSDGVTDDVKANEAPAHNNEKYNLSAKPPFDFNILDEMQHVHIGKSTLKDLKSLSRRLQTELNTIESLLKEEVDKRRKYKIDNSRRTHNYEPFIMTFLGMLAKQGKLADLIEKDLGLIPDEVAPPAQVSVPTIETQRHTIYNTGNKLSTTNGGSTNKTTPQTPKANLGVKPKPKYKYVSTGRPVGRPRKNPLVPSPVKTTPNSK